MSDSKLERDSEAHGASSEHGVLRAIERITGGAAHARLSDGDAEKFGARSGSLAQVFRSFSRRSRMSARRAVVVLASIISLASSAVASTYVVDASGSGQFTDIPAAIAAAHSGDVIVVLSGSYSSFTLDKGLTIIGYGMPVVHGTVTIGNLGRGPIAAAIALSLEDVVVDRCLCAVILQDLPAVNTLRIQRARDVRLSRVVVTAPQTVPTPSPVVAVTAAASRVEFVQCSMHGDDGPQSVVLFFNGGGNGLTCSLGARVHLARTDCIGGDGGPGAGQGSYGGRGGDGIVASSNSVVMLAGGGQSNISGGDGGTGGCCTGCLFYGHAGVGIRNVGGSISWSGANIRGPDWYGVPNCTLMSGVAIEGPSTLVVPDDPTLVVSGTPSPGQVVNFTLRGPPGSTANLNMGRAAIVVSDPQVVIELLAPATTVFALGVVPANGEISLTTTIPSNLAAGCLLVAQAQLALPGTGEVRRTNSTPIIVR